MSDRVLHQNKLSVATCSVSLKQITQLETSFMLSSSKGHSCSGDRTSADLLGFSTVARIQCHACEIDKVAQCSPFRCWVGMNYNVHFIANGWNCHILKFKTAHTKVVSCTQSLNHTYTLLWNTNILVAFLFRIINFDNCIASFSMYWASKRSCAVTASFVLIFQDFDWKRV